MVFASAESDAVAWVLSKRHAGNGYCVRQSLFCWNNGLRMTIATKNNAIILKYGKVAENCACCGPPILCAAAKPPVSSVEVEITGATNFQYNCSVTQSVCGTIFSEYLFYGTPINKTFLLNFNSSTGKWESDVVHGCDAQSETVVDRIVVELFESPSDESVSLSVPYLVANNLYTSISGSSKQPSDLLCNVARRKWDGSVQCAAG
jgi:hypothetical protein